MTRNRDAASDLTNLNGIAPSERVTDGARGRRRRNAVSRIEPRPDAEAPDGVADLENQRNRARGRRIIEAEIIHSGMQLAGVCGKFSDLPPEARSRVIALGAAVHSLHARGRREWLGMRWAPRGRGRLRRALSVSYPREELLAEYARIVSDPPSVLSVINKKLYGRVRYENQKAAQIAAREQEWSEELQQVLLQHLADELASAASYEDPEEAVVDQSVVDGYLSVLPAAERQAMLRELNDEPTRGAADRKARSRARKKLRAAMSQNA